MPDPTILVASAGAINASAVLDATTTALYALVLLLVAALMRIRAIRGRVAPNISRTILWCGMLVSLFALSIDHHAKISRSLVMIVRQSARNEGWYQYRMGLQGLGVLVALVSGFFVARQLIRAGARCAPGYKTVAVALVALIAFVCVRELSLHYTDAVMGFRVSSLSVGRLGEALILLPMALGTARWVRHASVQAAAATA